MKSGTVVLYGSMFRANASRQKAMSYVRMQEMEIYYAKQITTMFSAAREIEEDEDAQLVANGTINDLPKELEFAENRLGKIER